MNWLRPEAAIPGAIAALAAMFLLGGGKAVGASSATSTSTSSQVEWAYRQGKAAPSDQEARRLYQRGIDLARGILSTTPDAPEALLWLAANLAGEALTHGRIFALRVIPEIESTLLRLEQTNPSYDHAAAARALANLYWKAPAVISVGSSQKAKSYFLLALDRAADFPGNQAMAAAYFAARGDCARARPLALAVNGRAALESFGPDAAEWRQLARTALNDCDQ